MNRIINTILNSSMLVFAFICLGGCAATSMKVPENEKVLPSEVVSPDKGHIDSANEPKETVSLRLDSISLDKKSFDPTAGEAINIRYKTSKPCSATITICDSWGMPVKVLADEKPVLSSPGNVVWHGLDEKGVGVPDGIYFYVIELKNKNVSYIYNPYKSTHGVTLRSVTGFYDQEKGEVNYTLPQAAMVRIRVGLKDGGPLLITPLDWTAKAVGKYSLKWDGKDASGNINLSSHPDRNMVIFAYTLADNSIIVESNENTILDRDVNRPVLFSPELPQDRDIHARRYLKMNHEPRIDIEFQGDLEEIKSGIPIVKGTVPVKVIIAPEDSLALENSRYEIMFSVDTIFLFEDESGFSPFTYMWNTRGLSEGEHLITVNLWGYDDDCGVVTKKVFVQRDTK